MHEKVGLLAGCLFLGVALLLGVCAAEGRAAPPPGQFTVNANGTVTDNRTGLVWQREVLVNDYRTHAQALSYCGGLPLGGLSGWRLPEVLELRSIVDEGRSAPAIDPSVFPDTDAGNFGYWTATTTRFIPFPEIPAYEVPGAWRVEFGLGNVDSGDASGLSAVRCVR